LKIFGIYNFTGISNRATTRARARARATTRVRARATTRARAGEVATPDRIVYEIYRRVFCRGVIIFF
jgi:hypothetical protein